MNIQPMPLDQWNDFFDTFTRQHHGWPVNVRLLSTDQPQPRIAQAGGQEEVLARDVPLVEIREMQNDESADVMVTVGTGRDETSFLVQDVVHISVEKTNGTKKGLRIDSRNGASTFLELAADAPDRTAGLDG